jgi:hypothetical protein
VLETAMTIFSAKARQLIDAGVSLLPAAQTKVWATWAAAHPETRQAGASSADVPRELADTVLAALAAKAAQMRQLIDRPGLSEDAISDLDNDLTHLRAVEKGVKASLATSRSAA